MIRYYRMRTPGKVGVSARTGKYRNEVYLAIGRATRVSLSEDQARAVVAVLTAALAEKGEPAPEWATAPIEPEFS